MSDDIDIEEHDVLDNPNIRRIFPDLSIIKDEIYQYEAGLNNVDETFQEADDYDDGALQEEAADPHCTTDVPTTSEIRENTDETLTRKRLEVRQRFKLFLDSLVDDCIESNENKSNTNSDVLQDIDTPGSPELFKIKKTYRRTKPIRNNNKVILGSKPSTQHTEKPEKVKRQLRIVLKNVSPYLKASRRYCKDCFILFPNVKEFKCHIDNVHSIKTSTETIKTKQLKKCEICDIEMLKNNLPRHYKRKHSINKPNKQKRISDMKRSLKRRTKANETNTLTSEQTEAKHAHNCFHCQTLFETRSALIEHLYEVLNPCKMVSKDVLKNQSTNENPDIMVDKQSNDDEILVKSKKIKRMPTLTQDLGNEISNDTNNSTENVSQKTSTKENKPVLDGNELSPSRDKSKQTVQCNSIERHNSIEKCNSMETDESIEKCDSLERDKSIEKCNSIERDESIEKCNSLEKDESIEKCNSIERDKSIENNDSLSDHNMDSQSSDEFVCDIGQKTRAGNSSNNVDMHKKKAYQCFICSQYMIYAGPYFRHMGSHNITKDFINPRNLNRTKFDEQCHFCSKKQSNIKSYNNHVWRLHKEKFVKKVYLDQKATQSVIFKCFKCDVFFLSTNAAMNHFEHDEIFVDWKCTKCNELFKITDKSLHLKQHKLSKNITSFILSESALNRVLYKCLKCTVHFSEKEYFLHSGCDLETPSSAYCNTCDMLINTNDMELHENNHKKNLQLVDFPLIETDIIANKVKKCTDEKTNPYAQLPFALTFCAKCKCFLNNISRTRTIHTTGQCATVILPRMCRKCGLVFTASGYRTHQLLHNKIKKINMQSFYFYDMKTNDQIPPPAPAQPNCKICGVHFISRSANAGHECSKQGFTTCNICNVKFTQAAFKLHLYYHQYKLSFSVVNKIENIKVEVEGAKGAAPIADEIITVKNVSLEPQISVNVEKDNVKESEKFLFTCIPCNMTLGSYDKVVEHCHEHYDYTKIQPRRNKIDVYEKSDEEFAVEVTYYDPFYFSFNENVWIEHIFANLTKVQIDKILEDCMYKFEHRNKMEEIQKGPNHLVLYKCDMCRSFIDHTTVFIHASKTCGIKSKKYPCLSCGLCFDSENYRAIHEKDHDRPHITASSYRIILFNKIEHQHFNKMMFNLHKFILYQCRNCEAIVDKLQCDIHKCNDEELIKCATCGLLFYKDEFNSHVIKHEKIKHFKSNTMVIIMFGKLVSDSHNKQMQSSFSGTIYDLSFYRCTNCGLCLKTETDKTNHVCIHKSYISQCPKCYLYFKKKEMPEHLQFHDNNLMLGYDDFNSNIITFSIEDKRIPEASTSHYEKEKDEKNDNNDDTNKISTQTIYKCSCGLHFSEKPNAIKHHNNCNSKMKVSKQSCIKCDLLFTPGELFDHLLKHHSNKKIQYKYDIIDISEEK